MAEDHSGCGCMALGMGAAISAVGTAIVLSHYQVEDPLLYGVVLVVATIFLAAPVATALFGMLFYMLILASYVQDWWNRPDWSKMDKDGG